MTSQVLREQAFRQRPGLQAWVSFLRSHAALTRALNAQLLADHGLTINDYEVLVHLARAPERRLRRIDLADRLLLTASGITRLLDGLEREQLVEKARCESDARVTYAVLTDIGLARLTAASETHVAGVQDLFESRFSAAEIETLAKLLGRLPVAGDESAACEAP